MSLPSFFRHGLENFIGHFGYDLKIRGEPLRGPHDFFSWLKSIGFEPGTVIDVGVGPGTPWLYEAFPEAHFVLIEPNADFIPAMEDICTRYRGEYHIFAAGGEQSTGTLFINRNFTTSSGLYQIDNSFRSKQEARGIVRDEVQREVPIRPLDSALDKDWKKPFIVKLDVEGFETEALKGAGDILHHTDILIAEMSVVRRLKEEASFADFIAFLDNLGWIFFDIIDISQMGHGRLAYIDGVFVKKGSELSKV